MGASKEEQFRSDMYTGTHSAERFRRPNTNLAWLGAKLKHKAPGSAGTTLRGPIAARQ
jgi:hypothetical protein